MIRKDEIIGLIIESVENDCCEILEYDRNDYYKLKIFNLYLIVLKQHHFNTLFNNSSSASSFYKKQDYTISIKNYGNVDIDDGEFDLLSNILNKCCDLEQIIYDIRMKIQMKKLETIRNNGC